jgi:outer membrane immunogenic protein
MLPFGDIFHERNQLLVARAGRTGIHAGAAARRSHENAVGDIGMKRILIASAVALAAGGQALAADLPPPMAPPPRAPAVYYPPPPVYNWTGFYVGGNLGAAFANGSYSDTLGSTFSSTSTTSFTGGGQVGVNYEFRNGVVIGAEAMFDWLANTNNTVNVSNIPGAAAGTTAAATLNNRWVTTATGKLGYAWDRVLLYGKGGGAWVGTSNTSATVASPLPVFNGLNVPVSGPDNASGWTAGIGVEWAFSGNWSARAEYDYIGLQNQTYTATGLPLRGGLTNDSVSANNRNIQMVTAGVNYKFSGWWW